MNQAAATFGAGIYLALSLVGIMSTQFLNQVVQLSLDPFLRIWAETILAMVFAFVLLIASLLIGSTTGVASIAGGVLGTLTSILGVINALLLLSMTSGILPGGAPVQVVLAYELLFIMTVVVLVVGLPLALVGSFQHLRVQSG